MKPNGKSPVSSVNDHEVMFFKDISLGPHETHHTLGKMASSQIQMSELKARRCSPRVETSVSDKPEMLRKVVSSWALICFRLMQGNSLPLKLLWPPSLHS
ncbi:LOW QUALITY PROTEIN: hypothetical protein HID58_087257 [Brassica napus]|uniref:Uncharacterized protein n=1 Tax=Brassica napus TaxID=3708 RepID=A0ABQ7XT00_BRANA|nr:LOW QUALITY PROTEIN: hypothetical protein HID58_087257 [Brassica napus]